MDRIRKSGGLLLHMMVGICALTALAISPPAQGRMIVMPLHAGDSGAVLRTALRNGAGLVGRGPITGSLIISGELGRLAMPLMRARALLLAAPRGCGDRPA